MPKGQDQNKQFFKPKRILRFNWIYVIIPVIIFLFYVFQATSPKETNWIEFEKLMLTRHAVAKVEIVNNELAEIYIKPSFKDDPFFKPQLKPIYGNSPYLGPHYRMNIGSSETFERKLQEIQTNFKEEEKVNVSYINRKNWFIEVITWIVPILLFIAMFRLLTRNVFSGRNDSSLFDFGRSTATLLEPEDKSSITFDDVAGLEEAKVEVKEIVDFLKDPKVYTRLGAKIPKGIIIVGPPGTGKTLLVKAVANEAKVPFFSISGSEFVEMFVGVGASRVRDLFKKAKEKAPCIVFIDEIDAVGRMRGKNSIYTGANDERESTLNQLLKEMDGFGTNSGVIVLAATNRADMLDPALLRPGRFDRHIYLELPNLTERKAIFKVHLKPIALESDMDIDFLAAQTPGCSGADIANICNEAALIAARNGKEKVSKQDFLDSIDRIIAGLERKSKIISPAEKRIIAYHEAGHALVSWFIESLDPIIKVSIVPRGKTLGASWYLPEEHQLRNSEQLQGQLCAALGGRAAEELTFGDVTSGALDDLEKVTKLAYVMVSYYGFNKKLGNVSFYDSRGGAEYSLQKPYSEETGRLIDEEVRLLVENAYNRTKMILTDHRDRLDALANKLLEKEVVHKEDLVNIFGERKIEKTAYAKNELKSI